MDMLYLIKDDCFTYSKRKKEKKTQCKMSLHLKTQSQKTPQLRVFLWPPHLLCRPFRLVLLITYISDSIKDIQLKFRTNIISSFDKKCVKFFCKWMKTKRDTVI